MTSDDEKFDWSKDESVVVPSSDAVAVYVNPRDEIVIRRERRWDEDEDTFILLPRDGARALIKRLEKILAEDNS